MSSIKKVVITGASGFLGSHLLERLRGDEQYEVYALSSKPDALRKKIGGENIIYCYKDMLDAQILKNCIVINCAYPRNATGAGIADGLKYIQKLFKVAVENGASAIINISSQSVYSQQRTEVATEETPVCLESPYAVGKYAVELMLELTCNGSKTAFTSLRMASLIGPGFDQRIMNRFVKQMINKESITVVRQEKRMGFLDVEDAVNAILSVVNVTAASWQSIYNVGNDEAYTVEEIFNVVASELMIPIEIISTIIETGLEISSTAVSYERLNRDTGFTPAIDLHKSVKKIITQM